MQDSIFTKIIKGEIPCHKIYEDSKTIAFLDINPAQPGHTLVVPKTQIEFVWDLPTKDYQALMQSVQKVAQRLREITGRYVAEMIIGVDVPHAHVHLIPFIESSELQKVFNKDAAPDDITLAYMAAQLRMEDEL